MRNKLLMAAAALLLLLAACNTAPTPLPTAGPTPTLDAPPPGVRVIFTRRGGFIGYCDELTIQDDGTTAYRDTCHNTTRSGRLADGDAAYLRSLAARAGRFRYAPAQPPGADQIVLTFNFYGDAAGLPSDGEQSRVLDIAQTANDQLRAGDQTPTPAMSIEAVSAALSQARDDRSRLRAAIGDYLALPEIRAQTDADAAAILQGLLARAQVYSGPAPTVEIRRFGDQRQFALVNHPAPAITFYAPGGWQVVSEGTHITDLRFDGDRAAVISIYEGDQLNATLTLMGNVGADWKVLWSSTGSVAWQSTDGGAAFDGDGIARLDVAGLSLSPMQGESDPPFQECAMLCPRRYLSATWTLDNARQSYTRVTALAPGASFDDVLWDLAIKDEYATAFEFVRRLRAGDHDGALALATSEDVLSAAAQFGIDRRDVTINGVTYRLVFTASRPDTGLIHLKPFGLRTGPDGKPVQAPFEDTITLRIGPADGVLKVLQITQ
jgi:hypothetical protein